jgi:zinc protease
MNYHITRETNYSLGSIPDTSGVAMANITVDTHTLNTISDQALHHLYPEALMSGAGKYTREQFLDAVNLLGASIAVSISSGRLNISLRSTSIVFPKLLTLLDTMLSAPTFSSTELTRIKRMVSNELHTKKENSAQIAQERFYNVLYKDTDRRQTAEYDTIINAFRALEPKNLQSYHDEIFTQKWSCTIAGSSENITSFTRLVTKHTNRSEQKTVLRAVGQTTPKKRLYLHEIPGRSNIDFSIGRPVPITINHPDYIPLTFALGVLAIPGFAGRLMNTVRDKEGLTYGIYGFLETFTAHEPGHIRIATFFNPPQTPQGLTSTFREIKNFYEQGVTSTEFKRFQTIFNTKQALLHDSLKRQLAELHTFTTLDFSTEEITRFKEALLSVTKKQVNEVIKKYFNPAKFIVSGAGPVSKIDCSTNDLLATLGK